MPDFLGFEYAIFHFLLLGMSDIKWHVTADGDLVIHRDFSTTSNQSTCHSIFINLNWTNDLNEAVKKDEFLNLYQGAYR